MKNLILYIILGLFACCGTAKKDSVAVVLSVNDFKSKMIEHNQGFVLLDVRTPDEVALGKIPGATNVDFYSEGFDQYLEGLNKEKTYFVYCGGGVRSGKTATRLEQMGFKEVYDLRGGFSAWREAGEPTE